VTPLAKADPHNIMLRMDMINLDFQAMRILILKGRYREAEPGLANLITEYEKLNSEEDSGPGLDVLYQWMGEAQMGSGKFDAAITSYRKSIEKLGLAATNDDAICGFMTASVRMGDALLKLRRRAEAGTAYKAALAKLDAALAGKRQDMPALMPLAAAHSGLGDLQFAQASPAQNSGELDRLPLQGCEEYRQARELNKLITVSWTFNPTNFPGFRTGPALPQACNLR
jgi:tetratricopeptide (TPR) repeat protein